MRFTVQVNLRALLLVLVIGFGAVQGQAQDRETRNVSGFSAITIGGALEVYMKQGNTEGVELEGEDLESIITEVSGGTLRINRKGKKWGWNVKKVTAYITYKSIDRLAVSGASDVESEGTITAKDFDLELQGASSVSLRIETGELKGDVQGASKAKIKGRCNNQDIVIQGASKYDAEDLESKDVYIRSSGASTAYIRATGELDARAGGASTIRYGGNPERVNVDSSGASTVKRM